MRTLIIALVLSGAACAPKSSDTPATASDSVAKKLAAPSPAVTTASKVDTSGMSVKYSPTKSRADSIIGYDSAFGPKYAIDKDGKLVEIKRPPIKRP